MEFVAPEMLGHLKIRPPSFRACVCFGSSGTHPQLTSKVKALAVKNCCADPFPNEFRAFLYDSPAWDIFLAMGDAQHAQHDCFQEALESRAELLFSMAGGHGRPRRPWPWAMSCKRPRSRWQRALWAYKRATLRCRLCLWLSVRTGTVGAMVQLRPVRISDLLAMGQRPRLVQQAVTELGLQALSVLIRRAGHHGAVSALVAMPRLLLDPSKTLHVPGMAQLVEKRRWLQVGFHKFWFVTQKSLRL